MDNFSEQNIISFFFTSNLPVYTNMFTDSVVYSFPEYI